MNPTYFSLLNAALFGLVFYIFIPKTIECYRKFKNNSSSQHLYFLIYLLTATFYCLSIQFFFFYSHF